ncbi:GSCFA domain-containing protein [Roseibium sp. RKSG952]|uniref:GSCFA domain-containing protein n=1 Tax=Roseibium sp. RKSG952 TaxID=2529384 RepID=UPI0012BD4914|nr:GSCFA domain-containing protein [Roseibium sp. RKSG952]MTI02788.1 hypothetical protein [Roseibium sp. RKSG952]
MTKKAISHNFQSTTKDGSEFRTWFRGEHTNFNPTALQMVDEEAVETFVLKGWQPDTPCITPETQITAFGSCFAANISNWLSKRNFRVLTQGEEAKRAYVVSCGEGMVNSFVIRQQFEWAWENKVFSQVLWHGYKAEEYGYDPVAQAQTKELFDKTDVFILTFGLSEVWYDEPTGNVFWRTIPKDVYDPSRHKFRVASVEENRQNIDAIYQLIRKHRPDAKVIVTLSPIPLIATFRDNSCITSNSVSKASLRVAIDEVVRAHKAEGKLFYWPSYELVTDVFKMPYKSDRRHPHIPVLDYIMTRFEHSWCISSEKNPPPSLDEAWVKACTAAGLLPAQLDGIVSGKRPYRMRQLINGGERLDRDDKVHSGKIAMLKRLLFRWDAERKASTLQSDQ